MNDFLIIVYALTFVFISSFFIFRYEYKVFNKLIMTVGLLFVVNASYFHMHTIRGYPTQNDLPDDSVVNAVHIVKPSSNSNGGIYLLITLKDVEYTWIDKMFGLDISTSIPKYYFLEYTEERGKKYRGIQNEMSKGKVAIKTGQSLLNDSQRTIQYQFKLIDPREILKK